jgi:hypothetical protein
MYVIIFLRKNKKWATKALAGCVIPGRPGEGAFLRY